MGLATVHCGLCHGHVSGPSKDNVASKDNGPSKDNVDSKTGGSVGMVTSSSKCSIKYSHRFLKTIQTLKVKAMLIIHQLTVFFNVTMLVWSICILPFGWNANPVKEQ